MVNMPDRSTGPVDSERVWRHLRVLCEEIGPRLSGTAGDERAVAYMVEHFGRCGVEVEVQDFACPSWEHAGTELEVVPTGTGPATGSSADVERMEAVAQTFSLPCEVEAPLAVVGAWLELDLTPDLEGKVILLYGEAARGLALDRNATLLSLEERRAPAVIVTSPEETVATKLIRDPFLRVPAVGVPLSVGERLRGLEGATVRLQVRARRFASTGHNVIAHLPGREPRRVVVAAHYDSAALVPGATDNASGTAAVLELCELFAAAGPRRLGIDFVAFGADEYGRHKGSNLGAAEYVRRHPVEVAESVAVVEADGIGTAPRKPRVRLIGWPIGRREGVLETLARYPDYEVVDQSDDPAARPTAFNLPGVPAAAFIDDYRFLPIHTKHDTIDLMSKEGLAYATEVIGAVVEHLANG